MTQCNANTVYANFCLKFMTILKVGSNENKHEILNMVSEAQSEFDSLYDDPSAERASKYNCAIILSLMRYWPAYTAQAKERLNKGVANLKIGLERSSLSDADAAVVKAIVHQFENNEIVELDERVINNANPDLYAAARFIQDLAPYVRVNKENL